ncbi:MAG: diaminopimelate decarboxylase, partial [Planctomycetia bacterium]|nr:diaminopimelate decarboxylase [Planctomycetia bacterium]
MRRVDPPPLWWSTPDLRFVSERLCFGNRELGDIADQGTPVYVLRPERAASQLAILKKAAPDFAVYYAIKANRHPLVINTLRSNGIDGIDVCSPGEAQLAIANDFLPSQLSYTGTSVSRSDLDYLQANPEIHVNADSLSALRRLLETPRIPGMKRRNRVGLRINPELGLGYRQEKRLTYSGTEMSKFGILREQIDEACQLAKQYGATITTLHWHVGCGWLHDQKDQVQNVVATGLKFAERFPDLERINLGGGIGVPLVSDDVPVDLDAWSNMVRTQVNGRWQVMLEPGAFLVQ